MWGSAGHPVECGPPAARGSRGHSELCAENGVPLTPQLGLCSPPLGSSPLGPHHPDLAALHVPGRRPDPSRARGPELGTALRGQESLLFSWLLVLPETSTRLPCPSLPRQGAASALREGRGPPSSLQNTYPKRCRPLHRQNPWGPVLRTRTLAAFGRRWDRPTLLLQSQAESWEGSSSRSELPGHLGRGEHVGFTASPNTVISAGRFTGREMSLLRCSLSMATPFLTALLPDLARLPLSLGLLLLGQGRFYVTLATGRRGFRKECP